MNLILGRLRQALANEVLHDEGIEAARNACAAGASIAAAAIVAAAYYDSPLVGIPALRRLMQELARIPRELHVWLSAFRRETGTTSSPSNFAPGFGYVNEEQAAFVIDACRRCLGRRTQARDASVCAFFLENHQSLTPFTGALNRVGLMAIVCTDLGTSLEDAERYFMTWRVECAILEAQKARARGLNQFPFLSEYHHYEGTWPSPTDIRRDDYLRQIGLEEHTR